MSKENPETAAAVPPNRPTWLTRTRAAVAGGAAAVLIAGSLGGFAVGRATAGTGDDKVRFDQQVGPSGSEGEGDGRGMGPGGTGTGHLPPGQLPRDGTYDDQQSDDGTHGTDT